MVEASTSQGSSRETTPPKRGIRSQGHLYPDDSAGATGGTGDCARWSDPVPAAVKWGTHFRPSRTRHVRMKAYTGNQRCRTGRRFR